MKVLDKGSVELIDHMGTDLSVVDAARVSFSKESEWEYRTVSHSDGLIDKYVLSLADTKLINYLAKHSHWTPFAQCNLKFRIKMPIFVARQAMKTSVGADWNEISRRYVSDPPDMHYPSMWRSKPDGSIKQGSGPPLSDHLQDAASHYYNEAVEAALDAYDALLLYNVAPEQARMVLPQSMYTEVIVNFSLAAAARFCGLREDSHAQWEIQQYGKAMSELIRPMFPVSWAALRGGELCTT